MRTLRLREVKSFTEGRTRSQLWGLGGYIVDKLTICSRALKVCLLLPLLPHLEKLRTIIRQRPPRFSSAHILGSILHHGEKLEDTFQP